MCLILIMILFVCSRNAQVIHEEKPQLKIIVFQKYKTLIYNSYLIKQSFKGYHCKSGPSLDGGSLEISVSLILENQDRASLQGREAPWMRSNCFENKPWRSKLHLKICHRILCLNLQMIYPSVANSITRKYPLSIHI